MTSITLRAQTPEQRVQELQGQLQAMQERLQVVEDALQTLLQERAAAAVAPALVAPAASTPAASTPPPYTPSALPVLRREVNPPELIPEIGKLGAEAGITLNGSVNPFHLDPGTDVAAFIDLPLFDKPDWLHGKISYELSVGLSRSKTTFNTTSNVAQVANLAVLTALFPNSAAGNISDAAAGSGRAPFPVTGPSTTNMKLLQVVPFSFKYTTTLLDRWRLRPYALLGFGTYVTIHSQSPLNSGVRTDANLPPSVLALINSAYGGQAPFGGPLVAGQLSQSPELEARGLPGGHGNIDIGWLTGGGIEFRLNRSFSLGFDGRWNRISGAPGALGTYGTRLGFHF